MTVILDSNEANEISKLYMQNRFTLLPKIKSEPEKVDKHKKKVHYHKYENFVN